MARAFAAASSQYLREAAAVVTAYPFTMACWFIANDLTTAHTLMCIGDTGANTDWWRLLAAGASAGDPVTFQSTAGGTSQNAESSSAYAEDVWQHACAVGTSATSRTVYLNGGNTGSNTNANTPAGLDATAIGRRERLSPDNYTDGRIAEAAIWNVALTANEVAALAAGVSPRKVRPDALVRYWPLWGVHSPEIDLVGTDGLTVTGATAANHAPIGLVIRVQPLLHITVQLAQPSTDTTRDNWEEDDGTTTDIWDQIDEASADDTDYIRTQLTPTNDVYVTKLTTLTDPAVSTGHILRYRYRKEAAGGDQVDLTVELRHGYVNESSLGSLIASATHTDISGTAWTAGTLALTGEESDAISDYSNLFVRFVGNRP